MSPFTDTHISVHGAFTNELVGWIRCVRLGIHPKYSLWGIIVTCHKLVYCEKEFGQWESWSTKHWDINKSNTCKLLNVHTWKSHLCDIVLYLSFCIYLSVLSIYQQHHIMCQNWYPASMIFVYCASSVTHEMCSSFIFVCFREENMSALPVNEH